jgi:AcrR family transcriptional regulator
MKGSSGTTQRPRRDGTRRPAAKQGAKRSAKPGTKQSAKQSADAEETPRRTGGRSARVVSSVLRATLKELSLKGYAGLSVEEVALVAGVNKTTIYRRWPTRCDLVRAAMLSVAEETEEFPDTGSLRNDLLMLVRSQGAFARSPRGNSLARVRLAQTAEPDLAPILRETSMPSLKHAQRVIERAVDRGELRPGADATFLHDALLGAVFQRVLFTNQLLDDTFNNKLVDLVLGGLLGPDKDQDSGTLRPVRRKAAR